MRIAESEFEMKRPGASVPSQQSVDDAEPPKPMLFFFLFNQPISHAINGGIAIEGGDPCHPLPR